MATNTLNAMGTIVSSVWHAHYHSNLVISSPATPTSFHINTYHGTLITWQSQPLEDKRMLYNPYFEMVGVRLKAKLQRNGI